MNRTILFLICNLFFLICYVFCTTAADPPVVKVATDPWPPWTEGKTGTPTGGIAVELVEELFSRLDLRTVVTIYPFKRALTRIETGMSDVVLMVGKNEERAGYMLFPTVPIVKEDILIYYPAKWIKFEWHGWEDLKEYEIGTVIGYQYGKAWEDAVRKYQFKTQEVPTDLMNIDKLLSGRVDLILLGQANADSLMKIRPQCRGKLKAAGKPIYRNTLYFGISKKSFLAPRLSDIDRTLLQMQKDGTFEKIMRKPINPSPFE